MKGFPAKKLKKLKRMGKEGDGAGGAYGETAATCFRGEFKKRQGCRVSSPKSPDDDRDQASLPFL